MKPIFHRVVVLAMLAGCVLDAEPGSELAVDEAALAADPSAAAPYVACDETQAWGGVTGHLYWPKNGTCAASIYSPLVVIIRGNGFTYTDFDYLAKHLAQNGYIAVTIDVSAASQSAASYQAAADNAWGYVTGYVWSTWAKSPYINPGRVGLIGHSRGGEIVRYIAETVKNDPVFDVWAVVQLAPTEHTDRRLNAGNTRAALVLVGTSDTDSLAESAYRVHDRAGSDGSQHDPLLNPGAIYRAMKLLLAGTHAGFAVTGNAAPGVQAISTRGYVVGFLHAHLKNNLTYYQDYIRGDAVSGAWVDPPVTQYSDGFLRRTIDNFDDGTVATPTLAGAGTSIALGASLSVVDLAASAASPHYTRVLRYVPPANGAGIAWSLPVGFRDGTAFKYLSLRVGQIAGPVTDDLRIRITNGVTPSASLRVTAYGPLAQPRSMCVAGLGAVCGAIADQLHLGTIRIPLAAFGAHDDIRSISLTATSEATDGEFYVDNLELSEWIWAP